MRAKRFKWFWRAGVPGAVIVLMLGAGAADGGRAQVAGQQPALPSASSSSPYGHPEDVPPEIRARMDAERARLASNDRQKRLAQDADKLVVLANELKVDVNKTSKDELSMEVIRKAAEIEKLAHDVQNRMKN